MNISTAFLLKPGDKHRASAQSWRDGVIGSVHIATTDHATIQASDPQALRDLAAALIEAAEMADKLLAERAA